MSRTTLGVSILMSVFFLAACGSANSRSSAENAAEQQRSSLLQDGSYDCEVTNTTRGNGPYTLECEKSGDEIVIHFNNGGYINLDIDAQPTGDGSTWELEGTNLQNGDSWEVTINR